MKNITNIILVAVLLLTANLSNAQVLTADVDVVVQEQTNWCWAADSKCILDYYGSPEDQCEINNYAWSSNNCCSSPSSCNNTNQITGNGAIDDIILHFGGLNSDFFGNALSVNQITAALTDSRPFVMGVYLNGGGGHVVVGCGYNVSSSTLTMMDSWQNNGMTTSSFSGGSNITLNSGGGTWAESLVVTDNPVDPNSPPVANFSASTTNTNIGATIQLNDMSGNNPTSWDWDITAATFSFTNGTSNTSQNPYVEFSALGTYTVSLTATNTFGSDTEIKNDYITVSNDIIIDDVSVNACTGIFYDPGGTDDYDNNQDYVMTITPDAPNNMLEITFTSFDVEYESNCNYDYLEIFDGTSTSAPSIGKYCGTDSPGTVIATNPSGALTFRFYSDGYVTNPGWTADISCSPTTNILSEDNADCINIYPNPTSGLVYLQITNHNYENTEIEVYDMFGRLVSMNNQAGDQVEIDLSGETKGLYVIKIRHRDSVFTRKVLLSD